jgi:hypothetical protein
MCRIINHTTYIQINCVDIYIDINLYRTTSFDVYHVCLNHDVSISTIVDRKNISILKGNRKIPTGGQRLSKITLSTRVRHPMRREEEMLKQGGCINASSCSSRIYICIIKYMYIRARTDST